MLIIMFHNFFETLHTSRFEEQSIFEKVFSKFQAYIFFLTKNERKCLNYLGQCGKRIPTVHVLL